MHLVGERGNGGQRPGGREACYHPHYEVRGNGEGKGDELFSLKTEERVAVPTAKKVRGSCVLVSIQSRVYRNLFKAHSPDKALAASSTAWTSLISLRARCGAS